MSLKESDWEIKTVHVLKLLIGLYLYYVLNALVIYTSVHCFVVCESISILNL